MSCKSFTAEVDVGLDEWDDDELEAELKSRGGYQCMIEDSEIVDKLITIRGYLSTGYDKSANEMLSELINDLKV